MLQQHISHHVNCFAYIKDATCVSLTKGDFKSSSGLNIIRFQDKEGRGTS